MWTNSKSGLSIFQLLLLGVITAAAEPKLETMGACNDPSITDAIKQALASQGYKVTLDDGSLIEVWPRSQVSTSNKTRDDATYTLPLSTFVGVIHFSTNTRDYRGDSIRAGFYNLRYELQPADGDHLGTSPTPDFLLLVPSQADADPNRTYSFEELIRLSGQITGKRHPAPFNLVPAEAKDFPSVSDDAEGHTILFLKIKTSSGDLPIALVVKGTTTQ